MSFTIYDLTCVVWVVLSFPQYICLKQCLHRLYFLQFRYILVEPDPHAQGRQQWEECEWTAGKAIPAFFYRVVFCPKVVFSLHDRGEFLFTKFVP